MRFTGSLSLFLFILFTKQGFCQVYNADTLFLVKSINKAKEFYLNEIKTNQYLYNGTEYKESFLIPGQYIGYPFFLRDTISGERIRYNGVSYQNVPLLYDAFQDQLITVLPNTQIKLVLLPHLVENFTLSGCNFINIDSAQTKNLSIAPGYYQVLYNGTCKVFAKRNKVLIEQSHNLIIRKEYVDKRELFILLDGKFHPIRKRKSINMVLKDYRDIVSNVSKNAKKDKVKDTETFLILLAEAISSGK